ncbi:MAG TPA: DUF222 domain-containing protein [Jatrophihabitans sp.]|nr:DUF222 domain-containing protein [Jatrophihabitans sp.]
MTMVAETTGLMAGLSAVVQEVASVSLSSLAEDDLLTMLRETERVRRQLEALEHRLVAEVEERNLPGKYVMRSTGALLAGVLNLSAREAAVRVRHAHYLGPRITVTGERLEPLLPAAAAARAAGLISGGHVSVIIRTINKLPITLPVAEITQAEAFLVQQAQQFDPAVLAGIAKQLLDTLNPDGTLADDAWQQRHRFLSLVPNGDGMHRLVADLDGETAALAMTVLHSVAAPKTDPDTGDRDERSSGQRLHDALRAVLTLALRSGQLPHAGGVPASVLISLTGEQFETRTGLATTSFGQQLTVDQALRLADQASIAWIVHHSQGGVLNYGTTQRLASPKQTLALIARDKGCAFPGCTSPPEWTERHHVIPWRDGGGTDLNNLCLLCDYHHDRIDTGGWRITMQQGIPWFTPPTWIDPDQKPQLNQRIRPK